MKTKKQEEKRQKDITLIPFADMHTGSYTALHPNVIKINGKYKSLMEVGGWNYRHNNHFFLSSKQERIWEHLNKCLDIGAKIREGKKLVLFNMGEAFDGDHHGTHELVTRNITEQADTHIKLFTYIKERLNYQRGDELYCFDATHVHTGDEESSIGAQLGAYQYPSGLYSTSFLEAEINGKLIWAYHEGVKAGDFPHKGNAEINMLKRIYFTCKVEGVKVPDLILTAHVHNPHHATWTTPENKTMHYVILPSWQEKTRYVKDKMPVNKNMIGLQIINIPVNGEIEVLDPILQESLRGDVIKI